MGYSYLQFVAFPTRTSDDEEEDERKGVRIAQSTSMTGKGFEGDSCAVWQFGSLRLAD